MMSPKTLVEMKDETQRMSTELESDSPTRLILVHGAGESDETTRSETF